MADDCKRLVALFDAHWGFERVGGHKKPIHDLKAIGSVLSFLQDFKPDYVVGGGDMLDCAAISHWNRNKHKTTEGLRLLEDARSERGLGPGLIQPINEIVPKAKKIYMVGNHEDWLEQLVDEMPGLDGLIDIDTLLGLSPKGWEVKEQGAVAKIGKMYFVHGDQVGSAQYCARRAVEQYERSIRFGHFHTFQTHTKVSAIDIRDSRTGMAVPCLCKRGPGYGKSAPNRWLTGFLAAYVFPDGSFNDFPVIIVDGRFAWNGKVYRG